MPFNSPKGMSAAKKRVGSDHHFPNPDNEQPIDQKHGLIQRQGSVDRTACERFAESTGFAAASPNSWETVEVVFIDPGVADAASNDTIVVADSNDTLALSGANDT